MRFGTITNRSTGGFEHNSEHDYEHNQQINEHDYEHDNELCETRLRDPRTLARFEASLIVGLPHPNLNERTSLHQNHQTEPMS